MEQIEASTSYATLSDKLSSLPTTPTISPKLPNIPLEIEEWLNNEVVTSVNDTYVEEWKIRHNRLPSGPSSVIGIETSDNKYQYLDVVE